MKKFLATFALALGVITFATTTTHAVYFYPQESASKLTDCDLLRSYANDPHAVDGSYLEVNCDFGLANNDITMTTVNQKIHSYCCIFGGFYEVSLENVKFPKGTVYFVYQKIAGGHAPNWEFPWGTFGSELDNGIGDMTDLKTHVSVSANNTKEKRACYQAYFGGWSSGDDEKVAIYACLK